MKRIYLDHASATPIDSKVSFEMKKAEKFAFNPSSIHKEGIDAFNLISGHRNEIAKYFHCRPKEIIFTASGTESDNLAILGVIKANRKYDHVVIPTFEHVAVLKACDVAEKEYGIRVTKVPYEKNGIVSAEKIIKELKPETLLVSVMHSNNEIGTIQPIKDIARGILQFKKKLGRTIEEPPYLHTDFSQSAKYFDLNREKWGVDMMTIDGMKIYGPRGAGILMCRSYVPLEPIILGGGQEGGKRSGTENVSVIVGLSKAIQIVQKEKDKLISKISLLRDMLKKGLVEEAKKRNKTLIINGDEKNRLPDNLNICVKGINSEFAVIQFDEMNIACSSAAACNSKGSSSSYVIEGLNNGCQSSSIRFSLGRENTKQEILKVIKSFGKILDSLV